MTAPETGGDGLTVQYEHAEEGGPPSSEMVRAWARATLPADAEVTIRFVTASASQELNSRYLNKDRPANVLAFPYLDSEHLAGDIAISPLVAGQEAREAGIPAIERHAHLVVHACLHLRGMRHDTSLSTARMEAEETRLLMGLGFPDPFVNA